MTLSQILPTVNQLSHQDKLRLIHFLLLAIAEEEGCILDATNTEMMLLNKLASIPATIWSPQVEYTGTQALSQLLETAKKETNA
jgi:hypothetical protein